MTSLSRAYGSIIALAAHRGVLHADYEKACRRHRGEARASAALRKVTHAQLEAEIRLAKAAATKRAAGLRLVETPDLFNEAAE